MTNPVTVEKAIICRICSRHAINNIAGICKQCVDNIFIDGSASVQMTGKILMLKTETLKRLEATGKLNSFRNEEGSRRFTKESILDYFDLRGNEYAKKFLFGSNQKTFTEKSSIVEAPIYQSKSQLRLSIDEDDQSSDLIPDTVDKTEPKWSSHYLKCRTCGSRSAPHYGGGYCTDCYPKSKEALVLQGYIDGQNLAEVGKELGISRERARQLFNKAFSISFISNSETPEGPISTNQKTEIKEAIESTHKQNRASLAFKDIIEENYETIVQKLIKENIVGEAGLIKIVALPPSSIHLIEEEYPEFLDILSSNRNRWSWKYTECRNCHTTSIKHKMWGYCLNCYTRSEEWKSMQYKYRQSHLEEYRERTRIYGAKYTKRPEVLARLRKQAHIKHFDGKRDHVFKLKGEQCSDCGISRQDYREEYGKDMPVYHLDGNKDNNDLTNLTPLCLSCMSSRARAQ